jgi:hypothetical protein
LELREGDFFKVSFFEYARSFMFEPNVPLKLDDDEDRVVIGVGMSLVMLERGGALGLLYSEGLRVRSFFLPSSS